MTVNDVYNSISSVVRKDKVTGTGTGIPPGIECEAYIIYYKTNEVGMMFSFVSDFL